MRELDELRLTKAFHKQEFESRFLALENWAKDRSMLSVSGPLIQGRLWNNDFLRVHVFWHWESRSPRRRSELGISRQLHPYFPAGTLRVLAIILIIRMKGLPIRVVPANPHIEIAKATSHPDRIDASFPCIALLVDGATGVHTGNLPRIDQCSYLLP